MSSLRIVFEMTMVISLGLERYIARLLVKQPTPGRGALFRASRKRLGEDVFYSTQPSGARRNLALPGMLESNALTQEETLMRTLLLAGVLAVAGFAIATPISIAPASAQVAVDTPLGGVRVGPQPRYSRDYDRDYDRPAYRAYGYDRGYRGCRTVTIERDDGSVRRVRRCD